MRPRRMVADFVHGLPLISLVAMIAAVAIVLGLTAGLLRGVLHSPLETARLLAEHGSYEEAEPIYLDLAEKDPSAVPILLELFENHAHLAPPTRDGASPPARDARLVALLAQAPRDAALLVEHWDRVLHDDSNDEERAGIVAAADRTPALPWANDVLGREARRAGDLPAAARRFAREAQESAELARV